MTNNEDSRSKYFIGRDRDLAKIDMARKNTSLTLLSIKGSGGIGKTTLLNNYHKKLIDEGVLNKNILQFDFDDYRYKTANDIRFSITEKLGREKFKEYLSERDDFEELRSKKDIAYKALRKTEKKVVDLWEDAFKEQINNKSQIILLFDTLDALTEGEQNDLVDLFFHKPFLSTFTVITGRDKNIDLFMDKLKKYWTPINDNKLYRKISLAPFSKSNALEYFSLKSEEYGRALPWKERSETDEAIHALTEGVPILIDLFITVLLSENDNSFLTWIDKKNIKYIANNLAFSDFKCQFRQQLITRFSRTNQVNELVPLLAHVWPVNQKMLSDLRNMESDKAKQLMNAAKESAFIKILPDPVKLHNISSDENIGFMLTLHDIMREIMLDYGWENIDNEQEDRKYYSKKFLKIAENTIKLVDDHLEVYHPQIAEENKKNLCDQDRHTLDLLKNNLNVRKLKHQLFLNPSKGIAFLISLIDDSYGKNRYEESYYIKQLFIEIGYDDSIGVNYFKKLDRKEDERLIIDYLAREIRFWGGRDLQRAEKSINIIEKLNLEKRLYIDVTNQIIEYKIRKGQFQDAVIFIEKEIEYCKKEDLYKSWFQLLTLLGWVYRLIGDIGKANKSYAQAYELPDEYLLKLGKSINIKPKNMAYLLNSMSYVKALLRDYEGAINFANEAKKYFIEADYPRGKGMVESTLGRIEIEFNELDKAIEHFQKAIGSFPQDDKEWRSKIFLGNAHAFWLKAGHSVISNKKQQKMLFTQAKHELCQAEILGRPTDRAELFHLKANIAFSENEIEEAKEYYRECQKISAKMHALYYQARAITGRLKIAVVQNRVDKLSELDNEFKTFLEKNSDEKKDSLSLALFKRHKGDLYLLNGQKEEAIRLYKEALPTIAEYRRYSPFNLEGQIKELTLFFRRFIDDNKDNKQKDKHREIVKEIGKDLLTFWLRSYPCDKKGKNKGKETYSRKYPSAQREMSKWISAEPNTWGYNED